MAPFFDKVTGEPIVCLLSHPQSIRMDLKKAACREAKGGDDSVKLIAGYFSIRGSGSKRFRHRRNSVV